MSPTYRAGTKDISNRARSRTRSRSKSRDAVERRGRHLTPDDGQGSSHGRHGERRGQYDHFSPSDQEARDARSREAAEYNRNRDVENFRREGSKRNDFGSRDIDRSARRMSTNKSESAESDRTHSSYAQVSSVATEVGSIRPGDTNTKLLHETATSLRSPEAGSTSRAENSLPFDRSLTPSDKAAHLEFVNILRDFAAKVALQSSLQMQKEQTRTNLERMKAQFVKGASYNKDFSSAAESLTARIDGAQTDFDIIETKIAKTEAQLLGTLESFAARSLYKNNGTDSKAYLELKKDYEKLEQKLSAYEHLNARLERQSTDFGGIKRRQDESQAAATRSAQSVQMLQKDIKALQDRVDTSLNNLPDVKSKLESLSSRVDDFPRLRIDISKTTQEVKEHLRAMTEKSKMIEGLQKSETERNEEVEKIEARDRMFEGAIKKITANVSGIDEDLSALQVRMTAIESQAPIGTTHQSGTATSDAVEALKIEVEALRKGQEDTDEAYGGIIQGVQDRCDALELSFKSIKETFESEMQRLGSMISANDQSFSQRIENLQMYVRDLRGSQDTVPTQTVNAPNSTGFSTDIFDSKLDILKQDLHKRLHDNANHLESLAMGIHHLDTRMNNLSTDQLTRQMVGQLQTIYPNLPNVEASVVALTNTNNAQMAQLQAMESSFASLVKSVEKLNSGSAATEVSVLKEKLDQLRADVNAVCQQVEGLSTTTQKIDGAFISKEEVKEKTDVLSKSIGILRNDVDELSELKNSQPRPENSPLRSHTPPTTVMGTSLTNDNKRKRKVPTVSPKKTMNGHKRPRKKMLGGFQVNSDEEDFRPGEASSDDAYSL